jgi:hypothetical protein
LTTDRSDLSREQLLALVEELEQQQARVVLPESSLLNLRDGDVLVLEYPSRLSIGMAERMRQIWDEKVGQWLASRGLDTKFVVLCDGAKLRVIRHGED